MLSSDPLFFFFLIPFLRGLSIALRPSLLLFFVIMPAEGAAKLPVRVHLCGLLRLRSRRLEIISIQLHNKTVALSNFFSLFIFFLLTYSCISFINANECLEALQLASRRSQAFKDVMYCLVSCSCDGVLCWSIGSPTRRTRVRLLRSPEQLCYSLPFQIAHATICMRYTHVTPKASRNAVTYSVWLSPYFVKTAQQWAMERRMAGPRRPQGLENKMRTGMSCITSVRSRHKRWSILTERVPREK